METIEIRPALSPGELEQAYEIWGSVFPEGRSFFQDRLEYDTTYSLDTTWLALVNGTMAAAIQVFPYCMHWGSVELKVAGIGNVATLPLYRRRGLAQHILRRQCEHMRRQGYDLSMLFTGIHSFYEQLGWRAIPDKELVMEARALQHSVSLEPYRIRSFEDADLAQVSRMYNELNCRYIAPMVRTKTYWQDQANWHAVEPKRFLVAEDSGQLAAYLRYTIGKQNELIIVDCGYQAGAGGAAMALLGSALAAEKHVTVVRAELPAGHLLADHLLANGATLDTNDTKMWKFFSLTATLKKMVPELTRRVQQAEPERKTDMEFPAVLLFCVGGEEVLIRVSEEAVEVLPMTDAIRYNVAFQFNDVEWMTLLLKGYGHLENKKSKGISYLRTLFPELPYVFWGVDHY